jgi:hypothetical protein
VYPGNLANKRYLSGWLQEKERAVLPWTQTPPPSESPEPVVEEPASDVPMYADRPLFFWTEETMEAAKLPKLRRQVIREKQEEWQQKATVVVGDC